MSTEDDAALMILKKLGMAYIEFEKAKLDPRHANKASKLLMAAYGQSTASDEIARLLDLAAQYAIGKSIVLHALKQ